MHLPPATAVLQIAAYGLLVGACTGAVSDADEDFFGRGDAGPRSTSETDDVAPTLDNMQSRDTFLSSFAYASVGVRCSGGDPNTWVVISREPVDCAQHAAWIDAPSDEVMIGYLSGAGLNEVALVGTQVCAGDAQCLSLRGIEGVAEESVGPERWSLAADGRSVQLDVDVQRCDYDAARRPAERALARAVKVTDVSLYQAVRVPLTEPSEVPIIAGRPGLVRVSVTPSLGWVDRTLVAELTVDGTSIETSKMVEGMSEVSDLSSTFNFELPGETIRTDSTLEVSLFEEGACAPPDTQVDSPTFPGDAPLRPPVRNLATPLRVRLVPVRYQPLDNHEANVGSEVVTAYHDAMFSLYPVSQVEIETADPMLFSQAVRAGGEGWSELLTACLARRARDNAPDDVFYYCVVEPGPSARDYCGGACIAGLGIVSGPDDASSRAAVGLGYGPSSAGTFVHEVGHSAGRLHAPCGPIAADSVDPGYPERSGAIGEWGYDVRTGRLVTPTASDVMGYCDNQWISPHNYSGIFERLSRISERRQALVSRSAWLLYSVGVDGSTRLANDGHPIEQVGSPPGEFVRTDLLGESGQVLGQGEAYVAQLDHLSGSIVHVAATGPSVFAVRVPGVGTLRVR